MKIDQHNWACVHKKTNKVIYQLFDTRKDARNFSKAPFSLGMLRVIRVSIRKIKGGASRGRQ